MFGSFAFAHFADKSRLAHKSLLSRVAAKITSAFAYRAQTSKLVTEASYGDRFKRKLPAISNMLGVRQRRMALVKVCSCHTDK